MCVDRVDQEVVAEESTVEVSHQRGTVDMAVDRLPGEKATSRESQAYACGQRRSQGDVRFQQVFPHLGGDISGVQCSAVAVRGGAKGRR